MTKGTTKLVICLDNSGYEVSLERRKIYVAIRDSRAEKLGQLASAIRPPRSSVARRRIDANP